ncbi:hypothetical protein L1887_50193 [Cichorium endivia]|nr:hypothetical protein L1887_50193 [Cichorium endivia]
MCPRRRRGCRHWMARGGRGRALQEGRIGSRAWDLAGDACRQPETGRRALAPRARVGGARCTCGPSRTAIATQKGKEDLAARNVTEHGGVLEGTYLVDEISLAARRVLERLWIQRSTVLSLETEPRSAQSSLWSCVGMHHTYPRNERTVGDPTIGALGIAVRVGYADALFLVNRILARHIHQIAASALWGLDDLGSPEEAGGAGLVRGQRPRKTVVLVVLPAAKVLGVGALDVLAVAVGAECVPGLRGSVEEHARIGKVVPNHCSFRRTQVVRASVRQRLEGLGLRAYLD